MRTRRSALPSVRPKPRSSGSATKVALRRAGLNGAVSVKGWWSQNFRKIALLAHPDRGGNADLMKLMNELNAKLK